ncbi:MAG: hypothetical protein JWO82_3311 [Akkermansiaceae bacterium]|nr:hypothetical protein [Akkermansiaceae bacterium]
MKTALLFLLAMALRLAAADAEGDVILKDPVEVQSPDQKWTAVVRRAPSDDAPWTKDQDHFVLTIFSAKDGPYGERVFRYSSGPRQVANLRWSPDAKFAVMTTVSSGGHNPYRFDTYVYAVADRSLRIMADVSTERQVGDSDFKFEGSDIAVMDMKGFEEPSKIVKVPLGEEVPKMKKAE